MMSTEKHAKNLHSLAWNYLYYCQAGQDRQGTILFLHGITGSRRYWEGRVDPLTRKYRLIMPDLLGFGLSPKPYLEYEVEVFRDSVKGFLDHNGLGEKKLHIVGHSLGGIIALEFAAKYPQSVDKLVLLSLPRHEDFHSAHEDFWKGSPSYRKLLNQNSLGENLAQLRRTGLDLTLKYLLRLPWQVLVDARKFSINSLTSTLEHCLLHYRVDPVLEKLVEKPIMWIHGHLDQVAPFQQVKSVPRRFPSIRLESIPSSGHHLFLTHTRQCLQLIEDFLDGAGPVETPHSTT